MHTFRIVSLVLLVGCLAGLAAAPGFAQTGRRAVDVYPNLPVAGTPATFTFAGRVHESPKTVELPAAGAVSVSAAETHVLEYVRALARGDRDAILAAWNPAERETIAGRIDGKVPQMQAVFRDAEALRFYGEVVYGPYLLVLTEVRLGNDAMHRRYPLRRDGDGLFLTDELADDPFFSNLSLGLLQALADGRGRPSEGTGTGSPERGLQVLAGEIRYGMLPDGAEDPGEAVELVLRGEVYPEGEALVGPEADAATAGTDAVASLRRAFAAWREGTYGDVLALWAPDQQEAFTRYFEPDSFPLQRRVYQRASGIQLLARLAYGTLEIPVIEIPGAPGRMAGQAFAVRADEPGRGWTYELLRDPVFDVWRETLAEELARKIGPPDDSEATGAEAEARDETQATSQEESPS